MDKTKIWVKCLTTPHLGEPCGEDCLIQEYIDKLMKQALINTYLRTEVYTTNVTKTYTVNKATGEVYTEENWYGDN